MMVVLTSVVGIVITAAPVRAGDGGPVIVVPGRADVPVIMHGRDVSGAVVYGDWGLKRPGADLIIEGGLPEYPGAEPGAYYPSAGRAPAYGRKEIEPPPGRRLPPPAPTYSRSFSARSAPGPVTEYPPFDPPPVVLAPRQRRPR